MRKRYFLAVLFLLFAISGCVTSQNKNTVFQSASIDTFYKGNYDGEVSFEELGKHGDFGIGTFNAVDGEMLALDGKFYQIKADGRAYPVKPQTKTPFSTVIFFTPDKDLPILEELSYSQLGEYLDFFIPNNNIFYAVKIEGTFKYVKTRSIPFQEKPYADFSEVLKKQVVFEFRDVEGVMVGFRSPEYLDKINVPGYHMHFITKDKTAGGHVLDFTSKNVEIEVDQARQFSMTLPKE